jgi:hypothetical protein
MSFTEIPNYFCNSNLNNSIDNDMISTEEYLALMVSRSYFIFDEECIWDSWELEDKTIILSYIENELSNIL